MRDVEDIVEAGAECFGFEVDRIGQGFRIVGAEDFLGRSAQDQCIVVIKTASSHNRLDWLGVILLE